MQDKHPFILCAVTVLIACTTASAAPFYGLAQSIDGDSLHVGDKEVRLFGIDAPEYDQQCKRNGQNWACGQEAAERLSKLVTGRDVRCTQVDVDKHRRIVARCTVNGTNVNRTMVASGYAVAFRHYSTEYVSAEESARVAKRGIWAGTFDMPSDVRHAAETPEQKRNYRPGKAPRVVSLHSSRPQPSGGCVIKGNQGSNGWIYHVPGMPYYEKTKAEQIFCTEAEARAAGYRRAKVR